jgi:hypothetical protein
MRHVIVISTFFDKIRRFAFESFVLLDISSGFFGAEVKYKNKTRSLCMHD